MQIEARPTLILNTQDPEKGVIDLYWLVGLLKDIRGGSSLVLASKNSGTSYRGVWGKLNQVEASLGIPLMIRTKGHGSKLTEFGSFLCQYIEEMQSAYAHDAVAYQDALQKEMNDYIRNDQNQMRQAIDNNTKALSDLRDTIIRGKK